MNSQVSAPTQQFKTSRSDVSAQKILPIFATDSQNQTLQREWPIMSSQTTWTAKQPFVLDWLNLFIYFNLHLIS